LGCEEGLEKPSEKEKREDIVYKVARVIEDLAISL